MARSDNRTSDLEKYASRAPFVLLAAAQVTLIAAITVITVALPVVGRDLHLSESGLVLVSASYGISFGGLLPLGGRLADRLGRRRVFVAGMIIFGLASAGAGLAPWPGLLVAARLAEGAGAALAAPAAAALLAAVFPDPVRRGRALAMWGVLSSTGAVVGTVASGVLITWISWRWVFAAPAVIAAFAVAAAPRVLPEDRAQAPVPVDWPGAVLATAGLATLIYGVQRSGPAALAGAALLALFGLAERRSSAPLVPLAFLRRRTLPLAAVLVCSGVMAAAFLFLSLYLQQQRGWSALQTSAAFLLPLPAAVTAGPLAGRLIRRAGIWPVLTAGLAAAAAGLLLLSVLSEPYAGLLVFPFGVGLAFSASIVAVMTDAGQQHAGLAGALANTAMETGPPLGLTLLFWVAGARSVQPAIGYPFALRTAAVLLLALALSAILTRRTDKSQEES